MQFQDGGKRFKHKVKGQKKERNLNNACDGDMQSTHGYVCYYEW